MRISGWLAFLVACLPVALPAVADERRDTAPDNRRVGFSPLISGDLAAEHRYLGYALVRLLRERLEGIDGVEFVEADVPVGIVPRRIASSAVLDLLIWGEIETVSSHMALEIQVFDAARARTIWSYQESGKADILLASIDAIADGLAPLLLEQPWSRLSVEPVPGDSSVRLDGVLIGVGETFLRYTAARWAELKVSRPGYRDKIRQLELAPGQEVSVAVELVPLNMGTVLLDSRPAGAAVYVASAYAGVTPLRLNRFPVDTPLLLVLDGHADTVVRIGPGTQAQLTVSLQPAGFDGAAAQAEGRDRFYEELGWFAASLAPPLLLSALVIDFSARDLASHQGDEPIVWQPATIGVTIGALVAAGYSVYRLVRTIAAMINYTAAADRPAG